jgi:hypothetical protein
LNGVIEREQPAYPALAHEDLRHHARGPLGPRGGALSR